MRKLFQILLIAALGGVLFGIPCFYAGYTHGKNKKPSIDEMRVAYDALLYKASTNNNPEELKDLRRFSYDTFRAANFSGDRYGYKYSPEGWEGMFPALLEYELAYMLRTKTTDESTRESIAKHLNAYCRAMPFWSASKSNRLERVHCGVLGIYLGWYKEADKGGFDTFCLDNTNNVYVSHALSVMVDLEERKKQNSRRSFDRTKTGTQPSEPAQ
jgi:hypothetical protein